MAFNRIVDFFADSVKRGNTTPISPYGQSVSSGLLPAVIPNNVYGLANPGRTNYLRFSSSLQDLSTYWGYDPEEGDIDIGHDGGAMGALQPRNLERENGGSSFSKERPLPGIPFARKKYARVIMTVLCVMLLFFLFFSGAKYYNTYLSQEASRFYVVLDCGSTGTRVFVYESSIDHRKDGSLPLVLKSLPEGLEGKSKSRGGRAYHRMETEPGFDKLVHNVSGLRAAIDPLLRWAEKQIPKNAHKHTSLFLYATAGVRRLQHSDSEWLLNNAWAILRNSSFMCRRDSVKIITGMEEAYFGWVALNYQLGMLGSVPAESTFGALDLGGSSLQVTFETTEPVDDETSLNLNIGSINRHLSAYSLSGYGLNDAFDKSVVHLLKKRANKDLINGKTELRHPCLQTGFKEKYICSQCASQDGGSPLVGGKTLDKRGKAGVELELLGSPHWEECTKLAKVAVNLSEWSDLNPGIDCEVQPCALSKNLPRPRGQFYAMSGFFVVFRFFNLTSEATLDDVLQRGQEFCEKQWEVAKNSVVQQPFIEQYCFRAPYIVSLLREGLHIVDKQVVIGSGSTTWTLGVALLEAGGTMSTGMELHSYRKSDIEIPMEALSPTFQA
ncbi:hypothetical protein GIB67_036702 [Kingdonia uniflora]|uniref:Apyrase n=1 Tax=Kingdonia uniflora TaxID=39325 RepID=A0A7J7LWG3_9MAGN|nr:hypothetical protein GIB67_036702 [Kingdonia uniflora]